MEYTARDLTSGVGDPYGNGEADMPGYFPPLAFPGPPASYAWRNYRGDFTTDSHELRLSNAAPGMFDWVIGANWYKEKIQESDHNWLSPLADPSLATSVNAIDPVNTTTHTTYGVFGQTTWHVTDVWGVVLGLREAHDEVQRIGTFAAPWQQMPSGIPWPQADGSPCVAPNDCIGTPNDGSESASKLTYRVGLNAQLDPNDLVYASVATGYKAGGFNDFATSVNGATYAPENMRAYELGYKVEPESNIRFNSDVFYYDYSSDQISSLVYVATSPVIATRSAATKIYGWENELTWKLTANDIVDGSFALEKSKYTNFLTGALADIDWSGKSLDKTPLAVVMAGIHPCVRLRQRLGPSRAARHEILDVVLLVRLRERHSVPAEGVHPLRSDPQLDGRGRQVLGSGLCAQHRGQDAGGELHGGHGDGVQPGRRHRGGVRTPHDGRARRLQVLSNAQQRQKGTGSWPE